MHDINTIPTAIPTFSGSGNTERLVTILMSDAWVSYKAKMAAINRTGNDYTGNNVYLSSYTRKQRNSNGFTHVFGVRQHGETSLNTVRRLGMFEIKDGGH